jgi:organic hydroperoxide reductase OsmC/OhrA
MSRISRFDIQLIRHGDRTTLEAGPRPVIVAGAPPEFGGSDQVWSPEHLLVAAATLCFQTTFAWAAKRAQVTVLTFSCHGEGMVEKTATGLAFTGIHLRVHATVPAGQVMAIETVIAEAQRHCLVTHSLRCPVTVESDVRAQEERSP